MDNMQNVANAALDKQSVGGDLELAVSKETSNIKYVEGSKIMVIGVGGAGGNAVNHMQSMGITGVNFVVCNTDAKALSNCLVHNKIQMGPGLGAGNDPAKGRKYAIETEEQLRNYNCPIQIVSHGHIPHTVLEHHSGDGCKHHE